MQQRREARLTRLELNVGASGQTQIVWLSNGMNREATERAVVASDRWSPGDRLTFIRWMDWQEGPAIPAATDDTRAI